MSQKGKDILLLAGLLVGTLEDFGGLARMKENYVLNR